MAEPLRVRFAADVDAAKRGMAEFASSVASNAIQMASTLKAVNDNAQRVSSTIAAIPSTARNLAEVVAALVALKIAADVVEVAVGAAKDNLAALVKVGQDARFAGVSTNFLQAWTLQARELGTEASKLEGMLTHAREAATIHIGEGGKESSSAMLDRLGQHLKADNISQQDLDRYTGARNQEERIRAILDLIEKLKTSGKELAALDIGGKMFGADFEKQARAGIDVAGKMRDALDGKKFVPFDEEAIRNSERINKQLIEIDNLMDRGLAPIQRDLVRLGQQQYQSWLDIKEGIGLAVVGAGKLYTLIKNTLDALDRFTGENPLATLANKLGAGAIRDFLGIPAPLEVTVRARPSNDRRPDDRDKSNPLPEKDKPAGNETDAVESYIQALERSTAALKAEVEAYGKSSAEKEKAIALAKAEELAKQRGSALTDEERQKIEALGTAAGRAKDRMAELRQSSQQTAEAIRSVGQAGVDALADLIDKSRTADQIFRDLAKQMLRWSLQATFLGTGPFAGLLGTAPSPNGVGAGSVGGIFGAMAQMMGGLLRPGTPGPGGAATTPAAATSTPGIDALARTLLSGLGLGTGQTASGSGGGPARTLPAPSSPSAIIDASGSGGGGTSGAGGAAAIASLLGLPLRNITMLPKTPGVPVSGSLDPDSDRYKALQAGLEAKAKEFGEGAGKMTEAVEKTADGVGSSGTDLVNSLASLGSGLAKDVLNGIGSIAGAVPRFADGTDSAPGGLALVGERGPELMRLPRGAGITPTHRLGGLFAPKVEGARAGIAGTRVSAPLTIQQTIQGNGDATIAEISRTAVQQGIAEHQQHLERNLGSMLGEALGRYG